MKGRQPKETDHMSYGWRTGTTYGAEFPENRLSDSLITQLHRIAFSVKKNCSSYHPLKRVKKSRATTVKTGSDQNALEASIVAFRDGAGTRGSVRISHGTSVLSRGKPQNQLRVSTHSSLHRPRLIAM